jgi:hypothetical protein
MKPALPLFTALLLAPPAALHAGRNLSKFQDLENSASVLSSHWKTVVR